MSHREQSQIVGLSDRGIGPKALCLPKRKLVELRDPYWMPQKAVILSDLQKRSNCLISAAGSLNGIQVISE